LIIAKSGRCPLVELRRRLFNSLVGVASESDLRYFPGFAVALLCAPDACGDDGAGLPLSACGRDDRSSTKLSCACAKISRREISRLACSSVFSKLDETFWKSPVKNAPGDACAGGPARSDV
jgi:hypothetical protein